MNEEKDFFKTCFNTVARLEVKNESQAIAKEVVLSETERLEQENQQLKEIINKTLNKIDNMFDRGDANTIIDDLLELDKILKGSDM